MRRIVQKTLCLLLCAGLLGGCSTLPETSAPTLWDDGESAPTVTRPQKEYASVLPYSADDSLHPYKAATAVNRRMVSLLYEGLTAIDGEWNAVPSLATWEQTDATHLTFTLREDAVFSDGSPVTASDVTASFRAARQSDAYATLTANIAAIYILDSRTLSATLYAADPHAASAFSFPVIREQGGTVFGSGPYYAENAVLKPNPHKEVPATTVWTLRDLSRESEMAYALETGEIAWYFTELTDGEPPRSIATVGQTAVTLNDLLFVGVNARRGVLGRADVRRSLSEALSRKELCTAALADYAVPAVTPFVPTWSGADGLPALSETENIANSVAIWEEIGYNKLNIEFLYCAESPSHVALAEQVMAQYARAGVTLRAAAVTREEYAERVQNGEFDMYLGEMRLSADLSLRPFFSGDAATGMAATGSALYARYLSGELTATAFCASFNEELPFIPLCWKQGVAVYAERLRGVTPTGADAYGNIVNWTFG